MATIAALRTEAKKAGVAPSAIRAAENVKELEALIKRHGGGTKTSTNGRTAVKKSTTVRKSKSVTKATPTKRTGRKPAPAKGRNSSPAKRQAAATPRKAATKAKASGYEPKGGRNVLDGVNYSLTDGWNARPDSAPDTIIKVLKKFRGDREKAFDFLVQDIGDFVKPRKRDKTKWAKGEREQMLRYRIARTAWDFALKTGQHEKAENRVQYGTGGTGRGIWKPAKKAAPAKARTTKAATKTTRKPAAKATPARKATTRKAAAPARKRAVRRSK
jgi:hypothetical protein